METVCDHSINLQRRATRMAVPHASCQDCFATWPLLSAHTSRSKRPGIIRTTCSRRIRKHTISWCICVTAERIKIECMFAPKRQTTDHDSLVPQHSPDKCHHELAQEKNSLWARPTRLLPTLRQGMPSSDTSTRAYLHVRRDSCLTAPMRGNDANPSEST